jgi:hypothetical protein
VFVSVGSYQGVVTNISIHVENLWASHNNASKILVWVQRRSEPCSVI